MDTALQERINRQRELLGARLESILESTATVCAIAWPNPDQLDTVLRAALPHINGCKLLYAVDCHAVQYSSNVTLDKIDTAARGFDLSVRPYIGAMSEGSGFVLSDVYVSRTDFHPCVTALRQVKDQDGRILGCVAGDFDVCDLPEVTPLSASCTPLYWRQIKGDPAIRQNLFLQTRVTSPMDENLDTVNSILCELFLYHGVFHAKLHYSSSRATLWLYDDPHRYRIHVLDEIIDPSVCLAYAQRRYPLDAEVAPDEVMWVLEKFRSLRNADETIYLRSASLNIINGMVGLTFSCDGSHYMQVSEFLEKPDAFWFGHTLAIA
ncbi:MAG: hypothetical protein PVG66_05545 [Chromatiales bacterium]|jgi:hypothetical protein